MKKISSITLIICFYAITINAQWTELSTGTTEPLYSVYALTNDLVAACGANGTVIKSTDGGNTWFSANNGIPATLDLYFITMADENIYGLSGSDASGTTAFLTTNGGNNWFPVFNQAGGFLNGAIIFDASTGTYGLVGDPVNGRWTIFSSQNFVSWDSTGRYLPQVGTETGWNNCLTSFPFEERIYFGTNNSRIYYSSDGGYNWSAQPTPGMQNSYSINFLNNVGFSGGNNGICTTTDEGANWVFQNVPGTGNILSLADNGSDMKYIRGNSIYNSSDLGNSWVLDYTAPSGVYNCMRSSWIANIHNFFAVRSNGGISMYTPLIPVELTSFKCSVDGDVVNLHWSTSTETNNKGFEVQRRSKDEEFITLDFINGNGTSTEGHNYSYSDQSVSPRNYTYRLKQVDYNGNFEYSEELNVTIAPANFELSQNYPNPFNPGTKINFTISESGPITLKVFDILGNEVKTLVNEYKEAGAYSVSFNAGTLSSGIYFYELKMNGKQKRMKMLLMK